MGDDEIRRRADEIIAQSQQQDREMALAKAAKKKQLEWGRQRSDRLNREIEEILAQFRRWIDRYCGTAQRVKEESFRVSWRREIRGWKIAEREISNGPDSPPTIVYWVITNEGQVVEIYPRYSRTINGMTYSASGFDPFREFRNSLEGPLSAVKDGIATLVASNPQAPWPP
jgi:hypothetical protein